MKLEFKRVEEPYVFSLENETGVVTYLDASDTIGGKNKGLRPMEMLAGSLAGCAAGGGRRNAGQARAGELRP